MAGSTSALRIGVIAEDRSDVNVLYELTGKFVRENRFKFKWFVATVAGRFEGSAEHGRITCLPAAVLIWWCCMI